MMTNCMFALVVVCFALTTTAPSTEVKGKHSAIIKYNIDEFLKRFPPVYVSTIVWFMLL